MRRTLIAAIAAIAGVAALIAVATAVAQSFPARIDLPRGWQPEGIASGRGNQLFVGSIPSGAVFQFDARTGRGRVFVSGRQGRAAIGMKVADSRLFVAGGGTGKGFVYSARTGRPLKDFRFAPPRSDTFVNDVVVTPTAAYFTDSRRSALYVVPRNLSQPTRLDLPDVPLAAGNNLNGIVATPDGRTLIAVQTNAGKLWRISAATGRASAIDLNGASVANGDGLLLIGRTLYVVRNRNNRIAVLTLNSGLTEATLARTIRSGRFDVPTTVASIGRRLYAANARFATSPSAQTPYWVTGVAR
jgi:sugar lactone lactonase YvrE